MRVLRAFALLTCLTAAPAGAQEQALVLLGYGGLTVPTVGLADGGVGFPTAPSGGGGIALQMARSVALRATVTVGKSNVEQSMLQAPGVRRTVIGADLQVGLTTSSPVVPYFLVGLGRASFDPDQAGESTFTKLASRVGTGINYVPDNSIVAFFAELSGWFYRFDKLGFDRYQFDLSLAAGLAYAIPF